MFHQHVFVILLWGILWGILMSPLKSSLFLCRFSNQCIDRALERVANEEEMLIPAEDSLLLALLANPKLKRDEALVMITDLFTGGIDSVSVHGNQYFINTMLTYLQRPYIIEKMHSHTLPM